MTLQSPVIVTGAPRSGKTALARILSQTHEFVRIEEPLTIWNAGMRSTGDDCRSAEQATPKISTQIRSHCIKAVNQRGRYLDDLSYHALRIPFVNQVLPDSKIIHITRDAKTALPEMLFGWTYQDSVQDAIARRRRNLRLRALPRLAFRFGKNYLASRLQGRRETWGPRVPGLSEFSKTHPVAEVAAYQWARMNTIADVDLHQLPSDRRMQVRFEDLIAEPEQTMARVAPFLEAEGPDRLIQLTRESIHPERAFEKKVELDATTWANIAGMIRPVQERFGYSPHPPESDNAQSEVSDHAQ